MEKPITFEEYREYYKLWCSDFHRKALKEGYNPDKEPTIKEYLEKLEKSIEIRDRKKLVELDELRKISYYNQDPRSEYCTEFLKDEILPNEQSTITKNAHMAEALTNIGLQISDNYGIVLIREKEDPFGAVGEFLEKDLFPDYAGELPKITEFRRGKDFIKTSKFSEYKGPCQIDLEQQLHWPENKMVVTFHGTGIGHANYIQKIVGYAREHKDMLHIGGTMKSAPTWGGILYDPEEGL